MNQIYSHVFVTVLQGQRNNALNRVAEVEAEKAVVVAEKDTAMAAAVGAAGTANARITELETELAEAKKARKPRAPRKRKS